METKYYYIIQENNVVGFTIQCESKISDGRTCYLANSNTTGEEVWLYPDCIEFVNTCANKKHKIVSAYEVKKPTQGLAPYEYYWGRSIRDKRSNSMCARPYFNRYG